MRSPTRSGGERGARRERRAQRQLEAAHVLAVPISGSFLLLLSSLVASSLSLCCLVSVSLSLCSCVFFSSPLFCTAHLVSAVDVVLVDVLMDAKHSTVEQNTNSYPNERVIQLVHATGRPANNECERRGAAQPAAFENSALASKRIIRCFRFLCPTRCFQRIRPPALSSDLLCSDLTRRDATRRPRLLYTRLFRTVHIHIHISSQTQMQYSHMTD